jgi:hypothetical protein
MSLVKFAILKRIIPPALPYSHQISPFRIVIADVVGRKRVDSGLNQDFSILKKELANYSYCAYNVLQINTLEAMYE